MPKTDLQSLNLVAEPSADEQSGYVECLGLTFESEDARRAHFLARLKEELPKLRQRVDFPGGADEDILRLSDPPYYTACPNPFLAEFVERYGRPYDPDELRHKKPFAVDVSEGKTDLLYKAHSYHTKVPHRAIAPSILHYTEPGDIVLDGFCGSGMTGVAAQWCGAASSEYRQELESQWKKEGREPPKWGARRAILGDLSPAATFIAANYNIPFDVSAFAEAAQTLLDDVEEEIGWMYETLHTDGKTKGRINYTVWSEVFTCPECVTEIEYVKETLDKETGRTRTQFPCPACNAHLTKSLLNRLRISEWDAAINQNVETTKRVPVLINYTADGTKHEKAPTAHDFDLLDRIHALGQPAELPVDKMMHAPEGAVAWGDEYSPGVAGFSHIHQIFLPRAGHALSALWRQTTKSPDCRTRDMLLFFTEQAVLGMSLLNRFRPTGHSQVGQHMAGRIRLLSQHSECNPWYILNGKLKRLKKAFTPMPSQVGDSQLTTGDCADLTLPDNSVDYIFTDPPFGHNLAYSELNFVNEAFLRVFTRNEPEAIVSRTQKKDTPAYQRLMTRCFDEYCRVLKPGRWMTVVFHNSKNAIWNAIQEGLRSAGFVVADVRVLDREQGTYNQVNAAQAVKQDLVISAYKPNGGLEERFQLAAGTEEGAWEFVRTHLRRVPVFVSKQNTEGQNAVEIIAERQDYLLFDRMVAFHVLRGVMVPLSAAEFYTGLSQRFPERDRMYFLREQVAEYDRKRAKIAPLIQLELSVKDEESAIQWLRQQLNSKPQTYSDIYPVYTRELSGWAKHEKQLELSALLEENFLFYDGNGAVPAQIRDYLSAKHKTLRNLPEDAPALRAKAEDRWYVPDPHKAGDLARVRERALMREFKEYLASEQRRLANFRLEAVRAGFRHSWQIKDYDAILKVAEKISLDILQEDPKLLMWFDQARIRVEQMTS